MNRLLDELETRARAEIEQVERDARDRADALAVGVHEAAAARQAAALAECDAAFARRRAAAVADARREARLALLHAQHAFVDRVLERVQADLAARLAASGVDAFTARVDELRAFAASGAAEIALDARRGGFTLVADGGHLVIDDTVDAWLAAERARLAIDICRDAESAPC
ncbi:MAG TPA: hypothetical protein VHB25_01375 [Gemmatimonadaceae bacterium]|nr:hypothetical protein [Gemmatimonadaceae bacterium]